MLVVPVPTVSVVPVPLPPLAGAVKLYVAEYAVVVPEQTLATSNW